MSNKYITFKNLEAYTDELKDNLSCKEIIDNPYLNKIENFLTHGLEELAHKVGSGQYVSNCYKIMPMKLDAFKALFANCANDIITFHSQLDSTNIVLNFIGYAYLDTRAPAEDEEEGEAPSFYMSNYYMEATPVKVRWHVEGGNSPSSSIQVYANDWNTVIEDGSTIITGELILSVWKGYIEAE